MYFDIQVKTEKYYFANAPRISMKSFTKITKNANK